MHAQHTATVFVHSLCLWPASAPSTQSAASLRNTYAPHRADPSSPLGRRRRWVAGRPLRSDRASSTRLWEGEIKRQGWGYTLLTLHSVFTERWRKLVTSGLSTKQKQNKHAASFSSVNNRALKRKNTPHQMLSRLTLTQPYSDMNNSLVGVWISLFFVTD